MDMETILSTVPLSSGHSMPVVGLGMWQTEGEDSVQAVLEAAIGYGYRHIDSALVYDNETMIGSALQSIFRSGKVKREELFIAGKLPMNGMNPDVVEHFLRTSLEALQLDYLDLYLIHFPVPTKFTGDDSSFLPEEDGKLLIDANVNFLQTWQALESLVEQGLINSIGLSNFNSEQIRRVYDGARIKPAVVQLECHAYLPQFELVDFCQKMNISVTAYAPLGTPGLPEFAKKKYGVDFKPAVLLNDIRLRPLSSKNTKTPAQILLRYLLQRGVGVVPKSSNPERIEENINIFDFSMDEDDMKVLNSMGKNLRYFRFNQHTDMTEHPEYPFKLLF